MFNYEYPPLGGGTGIACQYLLREFKKYNNIEIDLVTSSVDEYKEEPLAKNIRVFFLDIGKRSKNPDHQSSLDLMKYFLKSTAWAMKHKDDYDLVHAFGGLPAGMTAWLLGKPYIVSLRGGEQPGYEPRFGRMLRLLKPILKLVYSQAKSVDANSRYLKKLTLRSFPNLKIGIIRNGVDQKLFYPAKKLVKRPVILCTSRFGERKGVKYLIEAMAEVIKKIPQAELWLVGEGIEKKKLKTGKEVKFLGKVEHKNLGSIYRQAKVFVLPSLSESMSNSLLEAMACGLMVVVTKVGGNPELVNRQNDILVPEGDSQALTETIVERLKNKQKRKLSRLHPWEKTAKKYIGIYKQLVKS